MEHTSSYIDNGGTRLFTTLYPRSGSETVVLLHGGPGVPDGLGPVATYLANKFQVISFHQRGTRQSPCTTNAYSLSSYVSDIDAIARHFGLPGFHLFGHSWGGLYAQVYAQQRKNKLLSMFLCSPGPGTGRQWIKSLMEVAYFNKTRSTAKEWMAMMGNALLGTLGSGTAYQRLFRQFALNMNKGFAVEEPVPFALDCIRAAPVNRTTRSILFSPVLAPLPDPGFGITVSYGDQDIFGASRHYVRHRYPTAQHILLPDSGHLPWLQQKSAFFELLTKHYAMD